MPEEPERVVTMFVRSQRVIDKVAQPLVSVEPTLAGGGTASPFLLPTYTGRRLAAPIVSASESAAPVTEANRMPQDEAECIQRTWQIAHQHGYGVHVVDIGRHSKFHARLEKEATPDRGVPRPGATGRRTDRRSFRV
jgi:hypothetical protein